MAILLTYCTSLMSFHIQKTHFILFYFILLKKSEFEFFRKIISYCFMIHSSLLWYCQMSNEVIQIIL